MASGSVRRLALGLVRSSAVRESWLSASGSWHPSGCEVGMPVGGGCSAAASSGAGPAFSSGVGLAATSGGGCGVVVGSGVDAVVGGGEGLGFGGRDAGALGLPRLH